LEKLFDKRTRAVLINSPSNPTGAVHSAEQLCQLIDICNRKKVPIISDEVYEKMVGTEKN
jgi:aspartate aminotransferase